MMLSSFLHVVSLDVNEIEAFGKDLQTSMAFSNTIEFVRAINATCPSATPRKPSKIVNEISNVKHYYWYM